MSDPASITLSPCPWCGDQPVFLGDDSYGSCYLSCHNDDCAAQPLVQAPKDMPELADQRWNARAALAQPARAQAGAAELVAKWREKAKKSRRDGKKFKELLLGNLTAATYDECADALAALGGEDGKVS